MALDKTNRTQTNFNSSLKQPLSKQGKAEYPCSSFFANDDNFENIGSQGDPMDY